MRSHRWACGKTCEQYERIGARLPGAPTRPAAGRRGRRRGALVRRRGPRQRHLFAWQVAGRWTECRPTCRGAAASRPGHSNRWRMPVENGLPSHRGARAAAFHRLADGAAGCGYTRPVLRSGAAGVLRSWDRRSGHQCSITRLEQSSGYSGGCRRRRLFLPVISRH